MAIQLGPIIFKQYVDQWNASRNEFQNESNENHKEF